MWNKENNKISMTKGDYGIALPITITGIEIESGEQIIFYLKKTNNEEVLKKTFENLKDNTFDLEFTKEESERLEIGTYLYNIDWYKENVFLGNIVKNEIFEVSER
jgi:hypothetical protein